MMIAHTLKVLHDLSDLENIAHFNCVNQKWRLHLYSIILKAKSSTIKFSSISYLNRFQILTMFKKFTVIPKYFTMLQQNVSTIVKSFNINKMWEFMYF